jgi:hypothetical protein
MEEAWRAAPIASGFVQREPIEGNPSEEQTEVRIVLDDRAVYVAARLYDSEPETIARQLVRRDGFGQFDYFEVAFDPNLDRRTGYRFRVSAANVQRDEYLYDDGENDDAWNAVWESAVQVDSLGWTVELRIPLSQMLYEASDDEQIWGVNFARRRVRTNEETELALVSRLQQGEVSQFGRLQGVLIPRAARRLEFRPYALGSAYAGPTEQGNPFATGSDLGARAGLDLRYGLGAQFSLNATINPDFGQVEADPAVINLTAFEVFFDERRPFFVEDAQLYDFSLSGGRDNKVFYSRRVGRRPHGDAPEGAAFEDVPEAATILGAAKITGRTSSGLSVGGLAAITDEEAGQAFFADSGAARSFLAEPRTAYGVLRLQQDFNGGASTIGLLGTVLSRGLPSDGSFDFLPRSAFGVGVDWEHQWNDRTWAFSGYVAGSHIRGDSTAMIRVQESSNHRFQRPDSRWVQMDSTATSMTGIDWRMTLEKRRGRHWTGGVWAAQVTPGFEINDLGFSRRQEVLDGGFRIGYQEIQPGSTFRSYEASFFTVHNWSHDALQDPWSLDSWQSAHVRGSFNLRGELELLNYWQFDGRLSLRPTLMDRNATRGGPLMLGPRSFETSVGLRTDRRNRFNVRPNVSYEWAELGAGSRLQIGMEMEFRPTSHVEIEFEPEWSSSADGAQYVATADTLPFDPTFGPRYLFADLDRQEVSLQTRVNVVFSPVLSLQLYAQPLLSSGSYATYKQFLKPQTFGFDTFQEGTHEVVGGSDGCVGGRTCVDANNERYVDFDSDGRADYSFTDQNFNVRSLVGNVVLRWEYRPGSTIFLVWQRRQGEEVSAGNFDFGRDIAALFNAPAENVFMIKVNYWLGL